MGQLLRPGNSKLGKGVWQVSLKPLTTCPGATDWCARVCYAMDGHFLHDTVQRALDRDTELLLTDPDRYERQLNAELAALPDRSIVRWHVAGDIESKEHAALLGRIAAANPEISFFGYTRSWQLPWLSALLELAAMPNVMLWASTEPGLEAPEGLREARVFEDHDEAMASGYPICPEQTGRRENCASCGLCWRAKEGARLGFIRHGRRRTKGKEAA